MKMSFRAVFGEGKPKIVCVCVFLYRVTHGCRPRPPGSTTALRSGSELPPLRSAVERSVVDNAVGSDPQPLTNIFVIC